METKSASPLWTKDFLLITLVNCLIFTSFQLFMPCLPLYIRAQGAAEDIIGLVVGIFTISTISFRPFVGRLLDTRGRKGIYLFGLGVNICAMIAYKYVPTVALLIPVRLLHGIGWSASTTSATTIATDVIPVRRMGEGMGYYGLGTTLAMAVGPMIGLSIFNRWGFSSDCNVALGLALASVLLALTIKSTPIKPARTAQPQRSLFERQALLPAMIMACTAQLHGAIVAFIAIYAAGFGIDNIGIFFTVYALALLLTRPIAGRLIDRNGYTAVLLVSFLFLAATVPILYHAHQLALFILAGITYGLGIGAGQPTLQTMAVNGVSPERRGAANSTFMIGFDLGMGLGTVIWGLAAKAFGIQFMYALNIFPIILAAGLYFSLRHRFTPKVNLPR
jgi:MFS family permease